MAVYDRIGVTYAETRRPDPRIDAAIRRALGGARSVVNVGAGSGSYEPPETVLAVEPSAVMIAQRPAGLAPAVQATAEAIPLEDGAVDAALAVLTIHHWPDLARGFAEMRRVAAADRRPHLGSRSRAVVLALRASTCRMRRSSGTSPDARRSSR